MNVGSRPHQWGLANGRCERCGTGRSALTEYAPCLLTGRILVEVQTVDGLRRFNTVGSLADLEVETSFDAADPDPSTIPFSLERPQVDKIRMAIRAEIKADAPGSRGGPASTAYELRSPARSAEEVIRHVLNKSEHADGLGTQKATDTLADELIAALRSEGIL